MLEKLHFISFVLFLVCVTLANSRTIRTGILECYGKQCPANTYACEKSAHVSEDGKQIVSEIRCLNIDGKSVQNVTTHEDNPFGHDVVYKSYSYKGAFQVTSNNEDVNSAETAHKESHAIDEDATSDVDPKSEVEDLSR